MITTSFDLPCDHLPYIFHCMKHVAPTSPQYEQIRKISVETDTSLYEYTYCLDVLPHGMLHVVPHFLKTFQNKATYDFPQKKVHFHLHAPPPSVYDIYLSIQFEPNHDQGTTLCTLTVEKVDMYGKYRWTPGFVRDRLMRHILSQLELDFKTLPPYSPTFFQEEDKNDEDDEDDDSLAEGWPWVWSFFDATWIFWT